MPHFNEEEHIYTSPVTGLRMTSVTELLKKHGLTPDYSFVYHQVLEAKAQFGTRIHKQLELFYKGETQYENLHAIAQSGVDAIEQGGITIISTEQKLGDDIENLAGTIDLIGIKDGLNVMLDIKLTAVLHTNSVEWQQTLYSYLVKTILNMDISQLYVLWMNKEEKFELIKVEFKTEQAVKGLFKAERDEIIYQEQQELAMIDEEKHIALTKVLFDLEEAKLYIKDLEQQRDEFIDTLKTEMREKGIKSVDNKDWRITYVAPQVRTKVDYKRYIKDNELVIPEEYNKETNVNDSVRITVRK